MKERSERAGTAVRLGLFAVVLVVSAALGAGLGAAVGPIDVGGGHDQPPATVAPGPSGSEHGGHGGGDDSGHDIDEPFEVPELDPGEGGS